jgi:hypothetical protein
MKKIILAVILLAAAGGATYYFLQKNKVENFLSAIDKELVIGKWKIDSLVYKKDSTNDGLAFLLIAWDSIARKQEYDFQVNGNLFISLKNDSVSKKDTLSFEWAKDKKLLWKEKYSDSATDSMTVIKLDKRDLVLRSADSTLVYFKKVE